MAYNNGFPINYPYYAQNSNLTPNFAQNVQNQQFNAQNNGIIWVQGEAGAKSYLIAPNTTIPLWDAENQVIYLKSADNSGMPNIKILDYTIRDTRTAQNSPLDTPTDKTIDYATKSEIDALKREIEALQRKIERRTKKDESPLQPNEQ